MIGFEFRSETLNTLNQSFAAKLQQTAMGEPGWPNAD
jgi:hypothetical protein